MALTLANRVRETTTTTGTGTVTLAGAVTGYQAFSVIGNANTTYYTISGQGTSEWEVGIGTYTLSGTTLSRDTVLASSNAGSAVNFSAGTKDVFVTYPSNKAVYLDASGNASALGTPASGTVTNLTGTASININGTVGATTPAALSATTGTFSGNINQTAGYLYSQVGGSIFSGWYGGVLTVTAPASALPTVAGGYIAANGTVGGTYTNLVGLKIDSNAANSATVTTNYGLLINNQTAGSTNYAIKTGSGLVDFGDNVSVTGTLSATSTLSTTGGAAKAEAAASQAKSVVGGFNSGAAAAASAEILTFAQAGTQKISHFWANNTTAYQIQTSASGAKIQLMPGTGGTVIADVTSAGLAVTGTLSASGATTLSSTLNVAGTTKVTTGTLAVNSSSSVFAAGADTLDYVKGYFTGTVNGTAGGAFAVGVGFFGTFDSGSTSYGSSFYSAPNTAAAAYTVINGNHIWLRNWTKGAGSSITYQRGILIDDQTGGASGNHGIESNVSSGSGKWNIYAGGTADNHFMGQIRQGSANAETVAGTATNTSFLTTASRWVVGLLNNSATPYGMGIAHNTDSNNTGNEFQYFTGAGTLRFSVRSNGGIANFQSNDANLSDIRTKKNIELAGNYLDKICAIPVKTFLYKDQTDEFLNLGVIAQDVEAVAPELIDSGGFGETPEDGTPLKAIYQTDLQFALMKAIQELAAKVAKLEAA